MHFYAFLRQFIFLYKGIHFYDVSLCHVNDHNSLPTFVLGYHAYNLANQTCSNVRKFVNEILKEFELTLGSLSFIVSDNGNKMKCSFNNVNRVGCPTHRLNKIMEKTFTDVRNIDLKFVQELLLQVNEIVEHICRCHKQTQIK